MKSVAYSDATSSISMSPPRDCLKKRSYRSNSFLTLVSIILLQMQQRFKWVQWVHSSANREERQRVLLCRTFEERSTASLKSGSHVSPDAIAVRVNTLTVGVLEVCFLGRGLLRFV